MYIYRFWGSTNVRRHIWSSIHINGQPIEYTGTGGELFKGFVIIMLVIFLPLMILSIVISSVFSLPPDFLLSFASPLLVVFWGLAIYRARRYRLSRTLFRGIRGSLTGSPMKFSLLYVASLFCIVLSLGWATPAFSIILNKRLLGEMTFGNRPFSFKGDAGPLYKRYAVCWLISAFVLPTLLVVGYISYKMLEISRDTGSDNFFAFVLIIIFIFLLFQILYSVIWSFYSAFELKLLAQYTSYENARFIFDVKPIELIKLALGNIVIMAISFGIAEPMVTQRVLRFFCQNLKVIGEIDIATIGQSQAKLDKFGEGLADALELDAF